MLVNIDLVTLDSCLQPKLCDGSNCTLDYGFVDPISYLRTGQGCNLYLQPVSGS